jgi:hypothetical protein
VAKIHGAAGLERRPLDPLRPFRAPHHTASAAGLLGGGNPPRPGEISLAHRGVLFLDELPEFDRRTLESLRQVLEERRVVVARAAASCVFPADLQLVAATNPCPCGWRGSNRDCVCDDGAVSRYASRMSGPLLDRIDLCVEVRPVPWRDLEQTGAGARSAEVRARVLGARAAQRRRGVRCNAQLGDSRARRPGGRTAGGDSPPGTGRGAPGAVGPLGAAGAQGGAHAGGSQPGSRAWAPPRSPRHWRTVANPGRGPLPRARAAPDRGSTGKRTPIRSADESEGQLAASNARVAPDVSEDRHLATESRHRQAAGSRPGRQGRYATQLVTC